MSNSTDKLMLGWREWVALPDLGITAIKAKVDTGARTSALHAFHLTTFERDGRPWVRFAIHPLQRRTDRVVKCEAEVVDCRTVTDSGGHREQRYVIRTPAQLGQRRIPIEITLTDRDSMTFRMLLGRTALKQGFTVDPARSYLLGGCKRQETRDK
ncbi:MAG: ATP-dependent zinc protease [Rhodocyclaceae bacterium]|nr:ATP-dependent zinc protease [Rhodocyclaceae bacterium]